MAPPGNAPDRFHTGRVRALADGIFAVAMTLLVFDLRVSPAIGREHLTEGLVALFPAVYSYVISFFLLSLFWWTHHRLMDRIRHAGDGFVWWNIFFLFAVTLVPFTAYVLGNFYGTRTAAEAYCLNLVLLAAIALGMWRHALASDLVVEDLPPQRRREITARLAYALAAYSVAALIAWWQPYWFFLGFFGFALLRPIARRIAAS